MNRNLGDDYTMDDNFEILNTSGFYKNNLDYYQAQGKCDCRLNEFNISVKYTSHWTLPDACYGEDYSEKMEHYIDQYDLSVYGKEFTLIVNPAISDLTDLDPFPEFYGEKNDPIFNNDEEYDYVDNHYIYNFAYSNEKDTGFDYRNFVKNHYEQKPKTKVSYDNEYAYDVIKKISRLCGVTPAEFSKLLFNVKVEVNIAAANPKFKYAIQDDKTKYTGKMELDISDGNIEIEWKEDKYESRNYDFFIKSNDKSWSGHYNHFDKNRDSVHKTYETIKKISDELNIDGIELFDQVDGEIQSQIKELSQKKVRDIPDKSFWDRE